MIYIIYGNLKFFFILPKKVIEIRVTFCFDLTTPRRIKESKNVFGRHALMNFTLFQRQAASRRNSKDSLSSWSSLFNVVSNETGDNHHQHKQKPLDRRRQNYWFFLIFVTFKMLLLMLAAILAEAHCFSLVLINLSFLSNSLWFLRLVLEDIFGFRSGM